MGVVAGGGLIVDLDAVAVVVVVPAADGGTVSADFDEAVGQVVVVVVGVSLALEGLGDLDDTAGLVVGVAALKQDLAIKASGFGVQFAEVGVAAFGGDAAQLRGDGSAVLGVVAGNRGQLSATEPPTSVGRIWG